VFWDLTTWFVIFTRFGAYLVLFPVTAAQSVPVFLRLGLAAFSALVILPLVPPVSLESASLREVLGVLTLEVVTGLTLGLLARFIFYAVEIAGSIIGTEAGMMLSSNFNPITSTFGSAPGSLLHWMTIVLLLSLNLHHWMIIGLERSYQILPAGGAQLSEAVLSDLVTRGAGMFVVAVQMTAPVLACSFFVTLIFSLLGRAVPQMNVFSESFPVRSIAGLAVFGLSCNLLGQHIVNHLHRLPQDFLKMAEMLAS